MGGVVLGSGARAAMETAMAQGVDDRPAARAVEGVPRLMGVRGLLRRGRDCEGMANLMDRFC
jgi:hypothetical protein